MNERIRELAEQAKCYADENCANNLLMQIQADLLGIPVIRPAVIETFEEKFAELIVRECMELAMTEKSRYANLYNKESDQNKYLTMLHCATSMDNYRLLLKEHFGVEE